MGEFVKVVINLNKCGDSVQAESWVSVCPVGVFAMKAGRPVVVAENEDECNFCGLCLEACPSGAVSIEKLYE